jgi:arabinofuranosyltransferase
VNRPLTARSAVTGAAWIVPLLILLGMGYLRRWVTDDAFISLRVAQHLLAGHGPVFNVGERVEAYTHPLWLAILAACGALGITLEIGALVLGLVFALVGLLAAQRGAALLARRLHAPHPEDRGRLLFPLGAIVFVAVPVVWDFVTSGLETGLTFAWLGGSYWLLARHGLGTSSADSSWMPTVIAVVVGLGPLVRPDLLIFSGAFLVVLAPTGAGGSWRGAASRLARLSLVAGVVPGAYQVFRMGYFAALVPNTALAKEASRAYWRQGWVYARDFIGVYALWIPLLLLLGWLGLETWRACRRRDWRAAALLLAPVVAAAVHALYVIRVGGDFMHGRFFLPSLFGAILPLAMVALPVPRLAGWRGLARGALALGVLGWALACGLWMRWPHGPEINPVGIADERLYYVSRTRRSNPITIADYLDMDHDWVRQGLLLRERGQDRPRVLLVGRREFPLAATVHPDVALVSAVGNPGGQGYAAGLDVHLVDRLGLGDPIAARLRLEKRTRPGHEKELPGAWAIARFSHPAEAGADSPEVVAAREALACAPLAELLRAVEEPLTVSRFLRNVRLSWPLTRLRIAADPFRARRNLCAGR